MKIKKIVPKDIYNARQGIGRFFLIDHSDQEKNKKPIAAFVYPVAPEDGTGVPLRFHRFSPDGITLFRGNAIWKPDLIELRKQ